MARPKPSFGDSMKETFRSVRNGSGMNPLETARQIRQAAAERETHERATGNQWYSKYVSTNDSVHLLLDRNGKLTTARPHVHVIQDGSKGYVEIILTYANGSHDPSESIELDAGGTEIDKAIEQVLTRLPG